MTEIQELRQIVQAQAERLTDTRAIAQLNEYRYAQAMERISKLEKRIEATSSALSTGLAAIITLTRLVERMGRDLAGHEAKSWGCYPIWTAYPYTLAGQREYDAAMHDAEGPDVRREDCVP